MEMDYKVSIIIPAYKEKDRIERCLKSWGLVDYQDIEIIVVVQEPETIEVLADYSGLRILKSSPGKCKSVNKGIRSSTGELIAVMDVDFIVSRNWIRSLIIHFKSDPNIVLVSGPANVLNPNDSYVTKYQNILRCLRTKAGKCSMNNAMFKKQVFTSVGPYLEDRHVHTGEEMKLRIAQYSKKHRRKWKIVCDPKLPPVSYEVSNRLTPFYHQLVRWNIGQYEINKIYHLETAAIPRIFNLIRSLQLPVIITCFILGILFPTTLSYAWTLSLCMYLYPVLKIIPKPFQAGLYTKDLSYFKYFWLPFIFVPLHMLTSLVSSIRYKLGYSPTQWHR